MVVLFTVHTHALSDPAPCTHMHIQGVVSVPTALDVDQSTVEQCRGSSAEHQIVCRNEKELFEKTMAGTVLAMISAGSRSQRRAVGRGIHILDPVFPADSAVGGRSEAELLMASEM